MFTESTGRRSVKRMCGKTKIYWRARRANSRKMSAPISRATLAAMMMVTDRPKSSILAPDLPIRRATITRSAATPQPARSKAKSSPEKPAAVATRKTHTNETAKITRARPSHLRSNRFRMETAESARPDV